MGWLEEGFWGGTFLRLIDYYREALNNLIKLDYKAFILVDGTSPETVFNRDNFFRLIVIRFPLETSKGFWIIGIVLLIVSKLKLFESYKTQTKEDDVTWSKIFKVETSKKLKMKSD